MSKQLLFRFMVQTKYESTPADSKSWEGFSLVHVPVLCVYHRISSSIPVSAKSMFQEATNAVRCLTISAPGLFLPAETRKFGEKRTMETTIHRCENVRFGGFKHYQTYSGHKRHAWALTHLAAGLSDRVVPLSIYCGLASRSATKSLAVFWLVSCARLSIHVMI